MNDGIHPRFYMGYTRCRPNHIPEIASGKMDIDIQSDGNLELQPADNERIGFLKNAQLRWSEAKGSFLPMWEYDTNRVIDSGGYNVQAEYLKGAVLPKPLDWYLRSDTAPIYPWGVEQYHNWLAENAGKFDWAAVMDYACEERFDPLWSVTDRIEATIHNTIRQFDLHNGEYELLPVLQGRSVEDYLYCYDRLKEAGIPVRKVGLGTVCRLSSSREIVELERELRSRREFDHIHGFGVKTEAYRMGATFESADSQAWVWAASHGEEYRDLGDALASVPMRSDSLRRTVVSFREYYRYVSRLFYGEPRIPPSAVTGSVPSEDEVTIKAGDGEKVGVADD